MAIQSAKKRGKARLPYDLNEQGANALLAATFEFLRRNNFDGKSIIDFTRKYHIRNRRGHHLRLYRQLVRTYDDMGVLLATWFSNTKFLDSTGRPVPLSTGSGAKSISQLIRVSGATVKASVALELMRQSPSIKFTSDGKLVALRRVFILPKFEVPRAAFVVERYLDTLQKNVLARKNQTPILLERHCYVSEVDLKTLGPVLREIDGQGTAFLDSIDGEIEDIRLRHSKRKRVGELGILLFAWTKRKSPRKIRKPPPHNAAALSRKAKTES